MRSLPSITRDRRIAISENMRIVALLVEAGTPHARDLAALVLPRLQSLATEDAEICEASNADIETMIRLAAAMEHEPARLPIRSGATLQAWDRGRIREQLEEASGAALSVCDSAPDSYIATAQSLGMQPHELQSWIYDGAASGRDWSTAALASWAHRYGFVRTGEPAELPA